MGKKGVTPSACRWKTTRKGDSVLSPNRYGPEVERRKWAGEECESWASGGKREK
jgi:hypothetical protein